jgi:hypothetical protein
MEMRFGQLFRQSIVAGVFALSFLAGIGGGAQVAAAEIDKAAFKAGCEAGGGSYVENADGSFQCNTASGITIKCPDTKSQCVVIPRRWLFDGGVIVQLPQGGVMQAIEEGNAGSADGSVDSPPDDPAGSQPTVSQPDDDQDQDNTSNTNTKDKKGKHGKKGGKHRKH